MRVSARAGAEVDDFAGEIASELADVGVVAVEEGDAGGRQGLDELIFCAGDASLSFGEVFDVSHADIGDDAPVGRGNAGKLGNFAGVIHAHFDDGEFVPGFKAQELERQAEAVIEISQRFENVKLCCESSGHCVFG